MTNLTKEKERIEKAIEQAFKDRCGIVSVHVSVDDEDYAYANIIYATNNPTYVKLSFMNNEVVAINGEIHLMFVDIINEELLQGGENA